MSVESSESIDWTKFNYTKIRVLRGLSDHRTEREIAADGVLGYDTVRGHVADLKVLTGSHDVGELARWWRGHGPEWHRWCAELGGLDAGETVPTVG